MSRHRFAMQAAGVCTLFVCAAGPAIAQGPAFYPIGFSPGNDVSFGNAISSDGLVAAGWSTGPAAGTPYLWTASGGRQDLTPANSGIPVGAAAYGLSRDGSTIVGRGRSSNRPTEAFRWSGAGTYLPLGVLAPFTGSRALAANADGSVVVGESGWAFRWTPQTGMQALTPGYFGTAYATSADGRTVFGGVDNDFGGIDAFAWTESGGLHVLPSISSNRASADEANGCTPNGTIVAGYSAGRAVRWVNGQVETLPLLAGYSGANALAINATGDVIVGKMLGTIAGEDPFVWTSGGGTQLLSDYFAANGVVVPSGWTLRDVSGVSDDGRTFIGSAWMSDGSFQAYVAVVPGPGAAVCMFGAVSVFAVRRRPRRVAPIACGCVPPILALNDRCSSRENFPASIMQGHDR